MLQSLLAAFAMYSKIPMPKVEWKEENMKYCLGYFPFVGVVTGLCQIIFYDVLTRLSFGKIFIAAGLTALPILINGGIHMDGFLDTIDAKSSWRTQKERLEILKDPHAGAFAIIYGGLYLLATFGLYTEITGKELPMIAVGYAFERVLSGMSLLTLKKAKKDGMAASVADASQNKVKWMLAGEGLACMAVFLYLNLWYGALMILTGAVCFIYYRYAAYKYFGGITGDLAGYFLQICELAMLLVLALAARLIMI